jgi:hypothetical protein
MMFGVCAWPAETLCMYSSYESQTETFSRTVKTEDTSRSHCQLFAAFKDVHNAIPLALPTLTSCFSFSTANFDDFKLSHQTFIP